MRDSALPWDTVATTRFRAGEPLDNTIESLTVSHAERAKDDPNFQFQIELIEAAEAMTAEKTVSLSKEKRWSKHEQELQRRLDRENQRRTALNLDPVESLDDIEPDDIPDILLDQAAGIVTDLATLREIATKPPQAAHANP